VGNVALKTDADKEGRRRMLSAIAVWMERVQICLVVAFLLVLLAILGAQIFARNVVGVSMPWSIEAATLLFSWLIFIGASLAVRQGAHFSVNVLPSNLSPRVNTFLRLLVVSLMLVLVCVFLVYGVEYFKIGCRKTSYSLRISMGWHYSAIPVGAVFMLFYLSDEFVRIIKAARKSKKS